MGRPHRDDAPRPRTKQLLDRYEAGLETDAAIIGRSCFASPPLSPRPDAFLNRRGCALSMKDRRIQLSSGRCSKCRKFERGVIGVATNVANRSETQGRLTSRTSARSPRAKIPRRQSGRRCSYQIARRRVLLSEGSFLTTKLMNDRARE